ncbi:hypothetical protein Hanom_Chr02g00125971 [Helianthus anomalus]
MSAASSPPVRVPSIPHVPEHIPAPDPIPFGLPDVAPLIPEPITAPIDLPPANPFIPQPPPADEIPAPRPGEGTSGQPPSFDPLTSADFPPIPHHTPFTPASLDKPFRCFLPYTMPISDPYHPSHYGGYTRDELLLSLQLQFKILSRRVLEMEFDEGARRSPFPFHLASIPPPSSSASFVPPATTPACIPGFDARFLTVEQQISFLIRRVHELEEELAHVRCLLFLPPPTPSVLSGFFCFMQMLYFDENATTESRLQRHVDPFLT